MKLLKNIVIFCAVTFLICSASLAENLDSIKQLDSKTHHAWWAEFSPMIAGTAKFSNRGDSEGGVALKISVNRELAGDRLISLRYLEFADLSSIGVCVASFGVFCPDAAGDSKDISLLYGVLKRSPNGFVKFAAGPGVYVWNKTTYKFLGEKTEKRDKNHVTAGLSLDSTLMWTPVRFIGLGINLAGNINPDEPVYGAGFVISLGDFKY